MSTGRYFDRICAIVLVMTLIMTVLFMNGQSIGIKLAVDADSEAHSDNKYFTENDQLSGWDTSSATYISLEGDSISISGNNAYVYNDSLVISGSGKYVITGTLDDGYIAVDANANSKVWILLNDVEVSCSDNACLRVDEADKVFLTLADGTANTFTAGAELSEEALADGTCGVIFAHDDLTINGSGSLQLHGGYKHGIKANDDLVITGGTITIDAPADGIHVNDSFRLKDSSVAVTAGDDGILTENEESFFYLESGEITLNAEGDGIHSNGEVIVTGGTITMDAGDDGIHAEGDIEIEGGVIKMNSCYEGIEGTAITVSGGNITIYPTDDGFNASSGSNAADEMFGKWGGDPGNMDGSETGMHPPEGEEAFSESGMHPPEGAGVSSESGTQLPEGTETTSDSGMPDFTEDGAEADQTGKGSAHAREFGTGQDAALQDTENDIRISGGTITIINEKGNDADGLDSNGDIFITGGDIRISLADSGTNSAIDAAAENGGIAEISGGTVIACGSSSMAESFDSTSAQCSIMYNLSSGVDSGAYLALKDAEGTELLSWDVPCSFSSAVVSSPAVKLGETYTFIAGENEESITLTEGSASYGDTQSMTAAGRMNTDGVQKGESGEEAPIFSGKDAPEEDADTNTAGEISSEHRGPRQDMENAGFMKGERRPEAQGANDADQTSAAEEGDAAGKSLLSYDRSIWILILFSFLTAGAGLLIAKAYKRR